MPKQSSKKKNPKKLPKMLLAYLLAITELDNTAEAKDWMASMPYSVRDTLGVKRDMILHPNNVMTSLRNNSENTNNSPSLHRLHETRTLTQANLNRLRQNEQNTSTRQSKKRTKQQTKSKSKRRKPGKH
jgi:hypothetical protein